MTREESMDRLVALFEEGADLKDLAAKCRCSYSTIRRRLRDRGMAMRPRGRPRMALTLTLGEEGRANV
jgi:hypothetical protein